MLQGKSLGMNYGSETKEMSDLITTKMEAQQEHTAY